MMVSSADDNEMGLPSLRFSRPYRVQRDDIGGGSPHQFVVHREVDQILTFLGYNEMVLAMTLLTDSPPVTGWTGAITIFTTTNVSSSRPPASGAGVVTYYLSISS
jgi:hypothetical protein